ncbi:uncharacterized protein SCHCODRAFT_02515603 [Schizophyllum commune H4-8]|uniref:uncharacterized protein n=1 Tax=Schizophyllum commune (strain H4-8 / FGSC 9210) TaxID=578458 RepID=UPI00215E7D1C|nr:uncharacterized protein SCHCODRAFT_02515603 [Schizophyllum commune H4-8]KAI5887435.1 hypothetical protein SCHCODRAFT_02515603 [Schizophyllum commune H4-8]
MSLTCRSFSGPATATLWRKLYNVKPLLRVLPPDIFVDQQEFALARIVQPADLERFKHYARFVQDLGTSWLPDETCLAALQLCFPAPLLPKLRHLSWVPGPSSLSFITMFLHPGITTLRLYMAGAPEAGRLLASSLVPRLPTLCPSIQVFEFHGHDDFAPVFTLFYSPSDATSRWNELRVLDLPYLHGSDIQCIASCSRLASLRIRGLPEDFPKCGMLIAQPAFVSLRTLELEPQAMHLATSFFESLQLALRLESLKVKCKEIKKACHWKALLLSIARTCDPDTLQRLTIKGYGKYTEDPEPDVPDWYLTALSFDVASHLLTFRNLTHLVLRSWGGFVFEDEHFDSLAQAFPDLQHLELLEEDESHRHEASIYALIPLARHCPRLHFLAMDFHADDYTYEEHETRGVCQRALTWLDVRYSAITSARVTAALLSAIFPRLACVSSEGYMPDREDMRGPDPDLVHTRRERKRKWAQVDRMLPMLRFVRAQVERDVRLRSVEGSTEGVITDQETSNPPLHDEEYDTDYSDV